MIRKGQARVLILAALASSYASASTQCPAAHLEPTLNYGRAFGNSEIITVNVDTGPRNDNEDLAFQYFEYQSPDPGFQRVFSVHVLHDPVAKTGRVILARLKDGKPVLAEMRLSEKTIERAVAVATPGILATRFRDPPCKIVYTDGYLIQAGVEANQIGFVGGEAFAPLPGTSAHRLEVLGRALRAIALGELSESKLEIALKEVAATKP
jgi:hypothetical protein